MGQGLVPKELVSHIKDRTDIADVIGGYVSLTRAGQNLKGLCPFHAEKTPSFTVSPSRQVFHCFGCGVGGDVVAFLMKRENVGFMEAVRELARRAGIEVPRATGAHQTEHEIRKEQIWKVHAAAAAWFRQNLTHPQVGREARDYLAGRGISTETAERFGLGYAPVAWDALSRALVRDDLSIHDLAAAGLIVPRDDGGRREAAGYYDRFRGRLMFPIHDVRGRIMAFGGRIIGEGLPKYLNSPDLPVFKKGTALYALPQAREAVWRTSSVVVVEGYFDAVVLHQAGIRHAVATLGTALTPEHVQTLGRLARKVVLIFDPDPAGINAAIRGLDLFRDSGMTVRVVTLPDGQDPDSFVRRDGAEAFAQLEAAAPSLLEFAVRQSLARAASGSLEDRIQSVDEVLRVLHKTGNPVEKSECLRRVAEELGLSEAVLIRRYPELAERSARRPTTAPRSETQVAGSPLGRRPAGPTRTSAEERELVRFLLQGQLSAAHLRLLNREHFSVPSYRRIVERAFDHVDETGGVPVAHLLDELVADAELGAVATELTLTEGPCDDVEAAIRGCLQTLERKRCDRRLTELIAELRAAERDGRVEEAHQLNAQVNALRMQKAIDSPRTL